MVNKTRRQPSQKPELPTKLPSSSEPIPWITKLFVQLIFPHWPIWVLLVYFNPSSKELLKEKKRNGDKTWDPADDEINHNKRRRNQPWPTVWRKLIVSGNIVIFFQVFIKEEELWFSITLKKEIFLSLVLIRSTLFLLRESIPLLWSLSERPLMGLLSTLKILILRKQTRFTKN